MATWIQPKRFLIWGAPAIGFILLFSAACSEETSFNGTELDTLDPAPPFQLHDQFAESVSLSDFAGKVVVLTFLYTYCPDVCPIVTQTLHRTHALLGDDAADVQFLAVSVDPLRDTVARVNEYSTEKGMLDKWHYLVGTEEELGPVWRAYWLDPYRDEPALGDHPHDDSTGQAADSDHERPTLPGHAADSDSEHPTLNEAIGGPGQDYLVSHVTPVFLIDRAGYRRVLFSRPSTDAEVLVNDIRQLIE